MKNPQGVLDRCRAQFRHGQEGIHLLVMPKLVIKLTTLENEHTRSFSRVVGW